MATKLFVGGLPWAVTDEELNEAFAKAGKVESAVVVKDKFSGRSRGFGFVEMATDEDAQKAQEMYNEKDFGGRTIVVNPARPPKEE